MHFIYWPKSGGRVFAQNPTDEVGVVEWYNGCRHVVGGVLLEYATAQPCMWWRDTARRIAGQIVALAGGVAWDEQGTIMLIVPCSAAAKADQVMKSVREVSVGVAPAEEMRANAMRLLAAGAYQLGFGLEPILAGVTIQTPLKPGWSRGVHYKDLAPARVLPPDVRPEETEAAPPLSLPEEEEPLEGIEVEVRRSRRGATDEDNQ